jgi:hypothetical protein
MRTDILNGGSGLAVPRELRLLSPDSGLRLLTECRLSAAQPISQLRLSRQQNTGNRHHEDGGNGDRQHRLAPTRPNRDHYSQHDSAENQPEDDAVQCEHLRLGQVYSQPAPGSS